MTEKYILAIDQGTTGTTVALVNSRGELYASSYREITQFYPNPGWVEHDPHEIIESVFSCMREVLEVSKVSLKNIVSIGIANQRETTLIWERKS
ncbi:MAG: FGGY family carbohydrate kinase, partial [SAR202 cluster bacterium]|nr:FGGY family carbohydrate kinase [SAR202 cluster bacterium]